MCEASWVTSELEPVAVLADRLQADGDPRGELLSLELAATLASSTEESRRLCLAAASLRAADPELAWPPALAATRGLIRAGLLVTGTWLPKRTPNLPTRVAPWCRDIVVLPSRAGLGLQAVRDGYTRGNLRLDGLWERRRSIHEISNTTLDLDPDQSLEIDALALTSALSNPSVLRQIRGLAQLDLGETQLSTELLATLPALPLRSLTVKLRDPGRLPEMLDVCPQLEELTLGDFEHELEPHAVFDRLRSLSVLDLRHRRPNVGKLLTGLSLSHLESLFLCRATCSDIEQLADQQLRQLTLFESSGDRAAIIAAVAKLDSLEHLSLHWYNGEPVDVAPLSRLPRLRRLEFGQQVTGELHAPATLESVAIHWSGLVRICGTVRSIDCGSWTIHNTQENIDLARVETLGLSASSFVQNLESPSEWLAAVKTLVLDGADVHPNWTRWLEQLPGLRTVIWPNLSIRQQRAAAERLPHLQILGGDTPRLRETWPPAGDFDPLAPRNWPNCE